MQIENERIRKTIRIIKNEKKSISRIKQKDTDSKSSVVNGNPTTSKKWYKILPVCKKKIPSTEENFLKMNEHYTVQITNKKMAACRYKELNLNEDKINKNWRNTKKTYLKNQDDTVSKSSLVTVKA